LPNGSNVFSKRSLKGLRSWTLRRAKVTSRVWGLLIVPVGGKMGGIYTPLAIMIMLHNVA
jgi:hypothetical protein